MTTNPTPATLQIAVLDRGFIYVGHVTRHADGVTITDAHCVRHWGTTGGLGQLAHHGPQTKTRLDRTGRVEAPASALIHLIDCDQSAWTALYPAAA